MAKTRKVSRKSGGGKKTRSNKKSPRKASDWAKAVKTVYDEMKRKNRDVKLGDAMKEASRRRKAGKL